MEKVIYYSDEINDDFAATNGAINTQKITGDYKYIHSSWLWKVCSFLLYRLILLPVTFVYMKLVHGMKIRNRKVLKEIDEGYFLYGNHTQNIADAFIPLFVCHPRKGNIIVGPDATSIPVAKHIVSMLGGVPLPGDLKSLRNFLECVNSRVERGQVVTIYPEAHIWPYYNGIRDFPDGSFQYPLKIGAPSVAFVVTYRERKHLKKLPPKITVVVSEPFYPREGMKKTELRNEIHDFMVETVEKEHSYAYIEYRRKPDDSNPGM